MKKVFGRIIMAMVIVAMITGLCVGMTACNKSEKLIIGVTDYAPMDYVENGEWTGFDAEMAKLFGKEIGREVEFVEIDWEQKISELQTKKIDLIWNGMTVTDELAENMNFSYSYAQNSQVAVIKSADKETYKTIDSMKNTKIAVESGSAGETVAVETFGEANVTGVQGQTKALFEVVSGTSKIAFIDYTMAKSLCGKGSYADLVIVDGIKLTEEEFAVGIRKEDTELKDQLNAFLVKAYKDGTMQSLATKFGTSADTEGCKIALCDLSNK